MASHVTKECSRSVSSSLLGWTVTNVIIDGLIGRIIVPVVFCLSHMSAVDTATFGVRTSLLESTRIYDFIVSWGENVGTNDSY